MFNSIYNWWYGDSPQFIITEDELYNCRNKLKKTKTIEKNGNYSVLTTCGLNLRKKNLKHIDFDEFSSRKRVILEKKEKLEELNNWRKNLNHIENELNIKDYKIKMDNEEIKFKSDLLKLSKKLSTSNNIINCDNI